MDHKQIIRSIEQGNFSPVYLLHGEEPYFIDAITDAIVNHAMDESERDFNQTIVYGKEANVPLLISDAKQFPMMGQRRLVVVKEAQELKDIDDLEVYFTNPLSSTVFVLCYKHKKYDSRKKAFKAIQSSGTVFLSEKVKDYKLVDWIAGYAKDAGYVITPKAAMLLSEFLGNDLSRIVNELEKLSILIEKGTTINDVHIEENIGISKDYNIFELTNAFGERNFFQATKIINYFTHNPKAGSIIPVIANLFKFHVQLMTVHFSKDKSKEGLAAALKVNPFLLKNYLAAAKIYPPKKLSANIAILEEFDLKSKGINNSSSSEGDLMKEMLYRLMH